MIDYVHLFCQILFIFKFNLNIKLLGERAWVFFLYKYKIELKKKIELEVKIINYLEFIIKCSNSFRSNILLTVQS